MRGYTRVLVSGVLATVLIGVSACSSSGGDSTAAANDKPLDKVTYLTAFGPAGRDAFAFVAREKGYFKEAGLDVDIQLGKASGENVKQVVAGQAQFSNLDLVGGWILEGTNPEYKDKFRAIAAVHQQSLVAILTLEGSGITSPKDLTNKKIGAATASVNQLLFPAYAKLAGFDPNSVKWVNTQPTQVASLLASGQVDAVSTFLIGKGGIEKAAGKKVVILPYNQYLSDLFGNGIIASNKILAENPDLCRRMRDALLRGLQYSIDHPDEAAEILHKAQPAAAVAAAKGEITSMTPYVPAPAGAPLGSMDEKRVAKALAILEASGLLTTTLKPESVVDFDLTPKA
ncbi:ABC transporter substrate-binding protein [Winogradskya humida]|uniref:Nitrate ABC transporter substrate-binding protein n=1 Tax=Winogradskya humida TaxID=113566 RepID=A0ABQ3ZXQ8_9ACTN|nr:ABC transporter substrate-binding protein [Actinoplanes humidus]GIE23307.1 nitrate ABC transporter substrate-binding protein [Actinoplanes humidus]